MNIQKRIGYSKVKDIPKGILESLEKGSIESATLAEITAIDIKILLFNNLSNLDVSDIRTLDEEKGILKKMKASARIINSCFGVKHQKKMYDFKQSDTLRGIGAFMVGISNEYSISQKIAEMKKFASDEHFGVREWAWMAIRDDLILNFEDYYPHLILLSKSKDYKIRRFSVESIRPKGVWATHLKILKTNPELAYELLTNLNSDPERYVQDSVGNWLNDMHKDKPDWIKRVCNDWETSSCNNNNEALRYIVKRGTRNL